MDPKRKVKRMTMDEVAERLNTSPEELLKSDAPTVGEVSDMLDAGALEEGNIVVNDGKIETPTDLEKRG